ncbi:MAG: nuclear transport factor 2 family protein [Anaerolineae bacterium]|nr:nuclear transport factor 2 family protein [Anaerolineae bacterium]
MNEQNNRQIVEALWAAFDRFDFQAVGPLLHDDFVCEWVLSGERIRGRENFIAVNTHYPGRWRCTIIRLVASGADVVTETQVTDGETTDTALSFFTLQDGQILSLREYWPTPYAAPDWRAQWVERME